MFIDASMVTVPGVLVVAGPSPRALLPSYALHVYRCRIDCRPSPPSPHEPLESAQRTPAPPPLPELQADRAVWPAPLIPPFAPRVYGASFPPNKSLLIEC